MSDANVTVDMTLATEALFPRHGAAIHVNFPRHVNDTPLHDHDFWEAAFVLDGHAVHRSLHGVEQMQRGDAVVLQPGQWHAWEGCRGLQLANCCIGIALLTGELTWVNHDHQLARLFTASTAQGQGVRRARLDSSALATAETQLQAVAAVQASKDLPTRRGEHLGHTLLFLSTLAAAFTDTPHTTRHSLHPAVETSLTAMRGDMAHDWGLRELAALAECSEAYLVRLFRAHCGDSPLAWLARQRAERAAVLLLTTDTPIQDIAHSVGYPDANYFARRFRAVFALSPSAYRQQLPCPALGARGEDWIQW
ncbi:MAG: AraC family transcriptional regulator [Planctomycetota bacterium]|jgi:AraC family L-rhamnose operon transcriptional activator RhaR|nr:AraC family transcriptional regulator [Planctomycetota bacterium]